VVGLGNPGERYRRTRHNAGFMALDVLAARTGAAGRVLDDAWVAEAALGGATALLVKPLSFMNGSGGPVARVLAARGGSPADLVVLVDDLALELGVIRVRERGSHGGHNGLRSLGESLGTEDFARSGSECGGASCPPTSPRTSSRISSPTRCCSSRRPSAARPTP